jgi:lysophosphatidate acyltransferase
MRFFCAAHSLNHNHNHTLASIFPTRRYNTNAPVHDFAMNSFAFFALLTPLLVFLISQTLCIAGQLSKRTTVEFYGRAIASFLALIICATYGTIASACLNVAGYGGLGQWTTARSFKWTMYYFTGVWFEIEDPHDRLGQTRPAVFVGNHQTELDVLFLGHMFPKYCSVTSKKSLKYVPFLGWFSTHTFRACFPFLDRVSS